MTTKSNQTECACCGNGSATWHKLATLFDRARVGFEDTDNAPVCDSCWTTIGPNLTVERIRARRSQPEPKREGPTVCEACGADASNGLRLPSWADDCEGALCCGDCLLVMVASPEHPRANGQEMEFLGQHGDMYKLRELESTGDLGPIGWNLPAATTQLTPSESVRAKYPGSHAERCEFCHDRLNGDNHAGPKLGAKYHRECVGQAIRQGIARMAEGARARRAAEPPKPDPYTLDKTGRPRDEAVIHEATAMADADAWASLSLAEKRARQRRVALKELGRPNAALVTWPEAWSNPGSES